METRMQLQMSYVIKLIWLARRAAARGRLERISERGYRSMPGAAEVLVGIGIAARNTNDYHRVLLADVAGIAYCR